MATRGFMLSHTERVVLGQVLRSLRKRCRMTMEDIADRCCCSQQQISKYEKGVNTPPFVYLLLLCDLAGITIGEFCTMLAEKGWPDPDRLRRVSGNVRHSSFMEVATEWARLDEADRRVVRIIVRALASARESGGGE